MRAALVSLKLRASVAVLAACACLGCSSHVQADGSEVVRGTARPTAAVAPLDIPAEQLPGPGECRVWIPGRAAEEQPHSVRCPELDQVPLGAWVITRPDPEHVSVFVYDETHPGTIISVRVHDSETGAFLGYRRL